MKIKNPFAGRRFDLYGLEQVLISIFTPVILVGLFVSMVCYPGFWAVVTLLIVAVGIACGIVYGIWKAFNAIFPKREDTKND